MSYANLAFDHQFVHLPGVFFTRMLPEQVAIEPQLLHANPSIAQKIGMDHAVFHTPNFAKIFSGNAPLPGGDPLAMAYSGHQFGHWAGQLGDGRALLLAQVRDQKQKLWDIQLKGSGLTPYSRMGDGRAVLRSCVREYLAGIALEGLGVPTTHALCLVGTNAMVMRETPEPGCVLTRIARSHIRFGHFEHLAHHGMADQLPALFDYLIAEHFPHHTPEQYLQAIIRLTAELIADWQAIGFAHGVMNTDNMSAIGITIDYGPYGFMDQFDLGFICNHSDYQGRYRFDRQPEVAHWNLMALCHAIKSVIPWDQAQEYLQDFLPQLMLRYHTRMMAKLGLPTMAAQYEFWQNFLLLLHKNHADYTQSFRELAQWLRDENTPPVFATSEDAKEWLQQYRTLVLKYGKLEQSADTMDAINPRYILRNWIAEEVIRALEDKNDVAPLKKLITVLENPHDTHENCAHWNAPPGEKYANLSVSCSS